MDRTRECPSTFDYRNSRLSGIELESNERIASVYGLSGKSMYPDRTRVSERDTKGTYILLLRTTFVVGDAPVMSCKFLKF